MALNKNGQVTVTDPGVFDYLGNPRPQYVPLADVGFGPPNIVMPHELPPSSMQFPTPYYNQMAFQGIPSVNVMYDEKRNGVAF